MNTPFWGDIHTAHSLRIKLPHCYTIATMHFFRVFAAKRFEKTPNAMNVSAFSIVSKCLTEEPKKKTARGSR